MREFAGQLNAQGLVLGVAVSRFNSLFTAQLLRGAQDCFERHGGDPGDLTVVWVPGANELPLAVQKLAGQNRCQALIALGCVVQGATPHADLINQQVARALATLALERSVPVINGIVCASTLEQAIERSGTKAGNKGWDAAMAAIEMATLLRSMDQQG